VISALLLAPTGAAAEADPTPTTCRVVVDNAHSTPDGQNPNWTWYCDDTGRPTYTELGFTGAWGLVLPYSTTPLPEGTVHYVAQSAHVTIGGGPDAKPAILWRMSKEYGGGGYEWRPVGPAMWNSRPLTFDDDPQGSS
jgi:hypothetical protein